MAMDLDVTLPTTPLDLQFMSLQLPPSALPSGIIQTQDHLC